MQTTAQHPHPSAAAPIAGALIWIAISLTLGLTGVLAAAHTPIPQLIILALTGATLWGVTRGSLRASTDAIPLRALVAVHAIRIVGVVFLILSAQGTLSPLFGSRAGWGDIVAAVTAIGVVAMGAPDSPGRKRAYLAWNVLGMLDLLVAVGTATLVALRNDSPGIAQLFGAPLILVPTFFVPLLLASHVVIFRRLRQPTS